MRCILFGLCLLCLSSPAYANPIVFSVGIPEEITLVVGVPTGIPAVLVNIGDTAMGFGCAATACHGISPASPFSLPIAQRPYLSMIDVVASQFVGLVLQPTEQFDFILATFTLNSDPPSPITPIIFFAVAGGSSEGDVGTGQTGIFNPVIRAGDTTAFSALTFRDDIRPPVVPDHGSTLTLAVLALACLGVRHGVTKGWG